MEWLDYNARNILKGYQPKVKKNKAKKETRSVFKGGSEHVDQTAPIVRPYNTDNDGNDSSNSSNSKRVIRLPDNRVVIRTNRSPSNNNRGQTSQQNRSAQSRQCETHSNSGGIKIYTHH